MSTIPLKNVVVIALRGANEDWYGLYELIWELNTLFPHATPEEKLEVGRSALRLLLKDGLIELSFRPRWSPPADYQPVARQEGQQLIESLKAWEEPARHPDGAFYAFAATEAGQQAFLELPSEAFEGTR
jgi:hypothetical protein